jgi:hypothetical protein
MNPQKVYGFLSTNPGNPFCDDCVEQGTGVDRHQVHTIVSTLSLFPREFRRSSSLCIRCRKSSKMVTEARRSATNG